MIELKVRKIDFEFPDDIAVNWNPGNPAWNNFVNMITLIGPAFERYFIKATRAALPRIQDPAIRHEAEMFCLQEAQHSRQHLAHLEVLTRQCPGLAATHQAVMDSYQHLYETGPLEFHLAYAANVELCFGPFARFIIDNRETYFGQSDPRIASFMLWHLIEEFEHRNAAYDVYLAAVGRYGYRLKTWPAIKRHIAEVAAISMQGLAQYAPPHADGRSGGDPSGFLKGIPLSSTLSMFCELACTLLPYHKPDNLRQPDWVTQWFADEAAGQDMRRYYPPAQAAIR